MTLQLSIGDISAYLTIFKFEYGGMTLISTGIFWEWEKFTLSGFTRQCTFLNFFELSFRKLTEKTKHKLRLTIWRKS